VIWVYRQKTDVKFPKLNCKIVGLRTVKGLDGVDFMLNKSTAKLDYLQSGDVLEALWLDLDIQSAKVSNEQFCNVMKSN
jgi:hypothetical protein